MVKINTKAAAPAKAATAAKAPATAGPKLAKGKTAAKPAKGKAVAAPKETGPVFKEGQHVTFLGYANPGDEPLFAKDDRLVVTAVKKDADGKRFYEAVKADDYEAFQSDPESVEGDQVYPSEVEKAAKIEVDPYAITVVRDARLTEILADYENPFDAAVSMYEQINENYFYFGGILAELYSNQEYIKHGDYEDDTVDGVRKHGTGWNRFCEENFDLNGRKGLSLIRMYRNFSSIEGLDLKALSTNKKIGWVKLDYMASVVDKDNAEELIALATEKNVHEFREAIRSDYVDAGEAGSSGTKAGTIRVKRVTITAKFFEDQAEGVQYVLEAAKKQLGFEHIEQVLEHIIIEWGSANLTEADAKKARTKKRAKLKELEKAGADVAERKADDAKLQAYLDRNAADEEDEDADATA